MRNCSSEPQLALLGTIPPRTPGRSDAQVPGDAAIGPARYARIAHLYFYEEPERTDAAYGLLDLEISIQRRRNDEIWLEVSCIGDGYQAGHGSGREYPLVFEIQGADRTLATVEWRYPAIICGHFDPMTFAFKTTLSAAEFELAEQIRLPAVAAQSQSCSGAPPALGGPHAH